MDDKSRLQALENALSQMLKPLRGLPFTVVVKALAANTVIAVDLSNPDDVALLESLKNAIHYCGEEVKRKPIRRPRPNEVGNDIEPFVMRALTHVGFDVKRPTSSGGKDKSTGYPDILFFDRKKRPTYLECKVYGDATSDTSMRSFYLSPSDSFKVTTDARHLLLAYGMNRAPIPGSSDSFFSPFAFKLVDLHNLMCDVKYEFNSDNKRLYAPGMIIAEGRLA